MFVEIERKFRVRAGWRPDSAGEEIAQGYLSSVPERTVRVRLRGGRGYLTVKGKNGGADAARRAEVESELPAAVARARRTGEVDVFHGENEGLVVAEIELGAEDEPFAHPDWLADEVTGDARYYNSSLARTPYRLWEER